MDGRDSPKLFITLPVNCCYHTSPYLRKGSCLISDLDKHRFSRFYSSDLFLISFKLCCVSYVDYLDVVKITLIHYLKHSYSNNYA